MVLVNALERVIGGDLWSVYVNYSLFFDFVAYALILGGLAHYVFHNKFKKYSNPITIGFTIALTFAAIGLESNTGFRLSSLGPYAGIIFLFLLGFLLYETLHALFGKSPEECPIDAAFTYLIIYGLLIFPFKAVYNWIDYTVPLLIAIIELLMVAAAVILVICLWKMIFKKKGGSGGNPPPPPGCEGFIEVEVVDATTQQPIPKANVWLEGTATHNSGTANNQGIIIFDKVACSKNIIAKAIAPGYNEGKHTDPGGSPKDPIILDYNIKSAHARVPLTPKTTPPPPKCYGSIEGVVIDKHTKQPISQARVRLIDSIHHRVIIQPTISDNHGRFKFDRVPCNIKIIAYAEAKDYHPGTHLDPEGNPHHELEITHNGQEIKDVIIPLEPITKEGIIEGFVIDGKGKPIGGAEVGLSTNLTRSMCISRKSDGYFKIDRVPLNRDLIVWAKKGDDKGNHTIKPLGHAGTTPQRRMQCDNISWNRYDLIILTAKCNHRINVVVPIICNGIISVNVIDKEAKYPIPKANVEIRDNLGNIPYSGSTNYQGFIEFKDIPCNKDIQYLAVASATGYKTANHTEDGGSPKHLLRITKNGEVVKAVVALERMKSLPPGTGTQSQTQIQTQSQTQEQTIGDIKVEITNNIKTILGDKLSSNAKTPCGIIKSLGKDIFNSEFYLHTTKSSLTFYNEKIKNHNIISELTEIVNILEVMKDISDIFIGKKLCVDPMSRIKGKIESLKEDKYLQWFRSGKIDKIFIPQLVSIYNTKLRIANKILGNNEIKELSGYDFTRAEEKLGKLGKENKDFKSYYNLKAVFERSVKGFFKIQARIIKEVKSCRDEFYKVCRACFKSQLKT